MAESPEELSAEQVLDAIRQMKVSDLLLSTLQTFASLGYAKLEAGARDLTQAQLSIDTLTALLPVAEGALEADTVRDFRDVVTNLQLAYAQAAGSAGDTAPSA